jgi:dihydrofolate reductase
MLISQIVAMASNRVIGHKGEIPWKIPGEQKMFRDITMGHAMIMGRKTYESIGRALPGRTSIVVTRQPDYTAPDCIVVSDLKRAFEACAPDESEAFIIGGTQIFQETMSITERIYLTVLPREVPGDTYFPEFPESDFRIIKSKFIDTVVPYYFHLYERIHARQYLADRQEPINKKTLRQANRVQLRGSP